LPKPNGRLGRFWFGRVITRPSEIAMITPDPPYFVWIGGIAAVVLVVVAVFA
jgi:hypothetical protein